MDSYCRTLGEMWVRGKVEAYGPDQFHRVDPPLLHAAATDILRSLDEARRVLRMYEPGCAGEAGWDGR